MGIEIERKFIVTSDAWRELADAGKACRQGYLASGKNAAVRVRIMGQTAWLTVKGVRAGISRPEFEYEIPRSDAEALLVLCGDAVIEKRRHYSTFAGHLWEIDVFSGANAGLVLAEIELKSEDQPFECPPWLGPEVSTDPRYFNAALARHPFGQWSI